jgi:hypothetical protein
MPRSLGVGAGRDIEPGRRWIAPHLGLGSRRDRHTQEAGRCGQAPRMRVGSGSGTASVIRDRGGNLETAVRRHGRLAMRRQQKSDEKDDRQQHPRNWDGGGPLAGQSAVSSSRQSHLARVRSTFPACHGSFSSTLFHTTWLGFDLDQRPAFRARPTPYWRAVPRSASCAARSPSVVHAPSWSAVAIWKANAGVGCQERRNAMFDRRGSMRAIAKSGEARDDRGSRGPCLIPIHGRRDRWNRLVRIALAGTCGLCQNSVRMQTLAPPGFVWFPER